MSAGRVASAVFVAAYGETRGIRYSFRFDGGPWSPWSTASTWLETNLPDGVHLLEARTRDLIGNADLHPDSVAFEIDATPPAPVISSPFFSQTVRGPVEIRGTAADARFAEYQVEVRWAGADHGELLARSSAPVANGRLADWETRSFPDGEYQLRLAVSDTLGLTGTVSATVVVQQNAPGEVTTAVGGDVYTTDGRMHLYFPPHGFSKDAVIGITPLPDSLVPALLQPGVARVLSGDSLDWGAVRLEKPGLLELAYGDLEAASPGTLALYWSARGGDWRRIGGTVDGVSKKISTSITGPGRYALFAEQVQVRGTSTLSSLSLTPRVFSPRGNYANREAAIGFTLGRAGAVTVRVFNRAGRLEREVAKGETMGAGANLIRWDGRDGNGNLIEDGLYLVTVEALGQKLVQTLAVVR